MKINNYDKKIDTLIKSALREKAGVCILNCWEIWVHKLQWKHIANKEQNTGRLPRFLADAARQEMKIRISEIIDIVAMVMQGGFGVKV